jgi:UDP-N-acetylglucosamine 2-epimerase (non-hydrolysing)
MIDKPKLLIVIGTRPEAIKLAPVILELAKPQYPFAPFIYFTGQHDPEMVLPVLEHFGLPTKGCSGPIGFHRQIVLLTNPGLSALSADLLLGLRSVLANIIPCGVMVQGDTTSAAMGALAAFYAQLPVFHVEAGLRTYDIASPFPEELNRQLISRIAQIHFTPTWTATKNIDNENIVDDHLKVIETGNTVVDALNWTVAHITKPYPHTAPVLVTCHRRENRPVLEALVSAVVEIARAGHNVLWPVHPSMHGELTMRAQSGGRECAIPRTVRLEVALSYPDFVQALAGCRIVITDSGGVQEEAPTFGKPVLVFRRSTEREEAIQAGTAVLVEPNAAVIASTALTLLNHPAAYRAMSKPGKPNPFGDGHAAERIGAALAERFASLEPG